MRFKLVLEAIEGKKVLPINYQYPLSSAIYKILDKADSEYAQFLHHEGYGKGYKFFCFSDIRCPFKIEKDRLYLKEKEIGIYVSFHFPEAMKFFVQGLFASQQIDIADKKSKQSFTVKSIEAVVNPLEELKINEFANVELKPISPLVIGLKNERWHYDYLSPENFRFTELFTYNWREKIKTFFGETTAKDALLIVIPAFYKNPCRSRLITIKNDTTQETKIRGFVNFKLQIQAERRFIDLLLNVGGGLYNSQGMGCLEIINHNQ
ncbi:CRISPR-associated endoribonuclease Cas6 [Bacteroides sp.]|uniref:CRISPR-associated endoribonuclease Cas6 n=1 Tax=Bacteroides sp. TaxID=29523 RepID=UPI0025835321|nr:CRISPR-associated endoribonuclease Cas6 [Bacteroides sp.]